MGIEHESAHAARHRELGGVEHVDGPDRSAGAGRIRINMQVDVDRTDQGGVGEAEVDRPPQRADLPLVAAGVLPGAGRERQRRAHKAGHGRNAQQSRRSRCA